MADHDQEVRPGDFTGDEMNRRRFLGATGAWAGALVGGLDLSAASAKAPPLPATAAQRFIARFDGVPPFSFTYGGRPSSALLATWPHSRQDTRLDVNRTQHTLSWTDPRTRLALRCVLVEYHDFPTVEWTLYVKNAGSHPSLPLAELLAIDTTFRRTGATEFMLHLFGGSSASPNDYQPFATPLSPGDQRLFSCVGGRPTNGTFPYFNIDWGDEGVIAALACAGQWAVQMTRDAGAGLHVQGGMSCLDPTEMRLGGDIFDANLVDIKLNPGEEIRSPLIVLQFWQAASTTVSMPVPASQSVGAAEWFRAQNVWRRWMIAHNMPRLPVDPPAPICPTGAVCGYYPGLLDSASDEFLFLNRYIAEHTTVSGGGMFDHWWMDAGWYAVPADFTDWTGVGTWQPDPTRYPHGLRPITNRARAAGMKSIVWHEPERVMAGTWLQKTHPHWLLGPGSDGQTWLLDLGNSQAWNWVVEHFDQLIRDQGVDLYRQDFNMDPLAYWNMADPPGRRGITQIRHVTGYLAFWDELRRRHPQMLIDSCASGGRRNDLETLRRAVPLLRSDYQFEPTGQQGHTYGLSFWIPYYGTGVSPESTNGGAYGSGAYVMRSSFAPVYASSLDVRTAPAAAWNLMKQMTREWREIAPNLLGDYYPLADYSLDTDVWLAVQFHRPNLDEGVVLAWRRADTTSPTQRFIMQGLEASATYELKNFDGPRITRVTGHDLLHAGLLVRLDSRPAAATIAYKRVTS